MTPSTPTRAIMTVLGLIPARGGSKGVPDKNIKPLCGESLIQRAYTTARDSGALDRIILSTDCARIAEHGKSIGVEVPFLRPEAFATDRSPMIDVVRHALGYLEETEGYRPDAVMLLQPTSPLRRKDHILEALGKLPDAESVCSVVPVPQEYSPSYLMRIDSGGILRFFTEEGPRLTRRQDAAIAYKRDGTIFLTKTETLLKKNSFIGDRCLPMILAMEDYLNIDTPEQWDDAVRVLGNRASKSCLPR